MARRPSVGLDIGTHGIYLAEVTASRQGPKLTNFGGIALPEGAVDEGEIVDIGTVSDAVRQLYDETDVREKRVHVGVANQRVVVRQIDLPYMEDDELDSALRYQVQEYIPIPVDEAELDYQKLEEIVEDGDTRMLRILLVAADKSMVANHLEAATSAGLRPIGADLNAFATLRAAVPDPESVAETQMLVDIGAGVTNILIHDHGIPRFVRLLVLGGGDITQALRTELGVSFEEAERLKREQALEDRDDEATGIIDRGMREFVDEIRGSLDYYLTSASGAPVERVLLTGGGSKMAGIGRRLEDTLNVPVERARPLDHLQVSDSDYDHDALLAVEPLLATAIGLALGGLK